LKEQSKGFGTFLLMGHEWADTAASKRSYELFARYVAPQFTGKSVSLTASRDWAATNRPAFIGAAGDAIMSAIQKHADEGAAKAKGQKAKAKKSATKKAATAKKAKRAPTVTKKKSATKRARSA
jgi:hypothetical protein